MCSSSSSSPLVSPLFLSAAISVFDFCVCFFCEDLTFSVRLIPRQRSVGQRVKASFVASDRTYGARAVSGWICCQKASHAVMHRKRRSQGKHAA